jgi:hypothetical protein
MIGQTRRALSSLEGDVYATALARSAIQTEKPAVQTKANRFQIERL